MDLSLHWRREGGHDLPLWLWRFPETSTVLSSAPYGGGLGRRRWVLNAQVPLDYARCDPERHLGELADDLDLGPFGVGLLTAAEVEHLSRAEDGGVRCAATVGLGTPTWAAAPALADGEAGPGAGGGPGDASAAATVGTINILLWSPVALTSAALVNAVATATEAKVQALLEAGLDGTGTATDTVVVACPLVADGQVPEAFGGPRSRLGASLARAVHEVVADGSRRWFARALPERAARARGLHGAAGPTADRSRPPEVPA